MAMPTFPGTVYQENADNPMQDNNVTFIQVTLAGKGYLKRKNITGKYDAETVTAVKQFQTDNDLTIDGIVGEKTWNKLFDYIKNVDDDKALEDNDYLLKTMASNNEDTFFGKGRKQILRNNNSTITIVYGNNHMTKTIKNVIFRSKSHTISSDGTPVSDVYEFVGRDLEESQEN